MVGSLQQDQFNSKDGARTPTKPLGPAGTRPLPVSAVPDRELVLRTSELLENLDQRIEALIQACQRAKLPLPGVIIPTPFMHPLTPSSHKVLAYLERKLLGDDRLAQAVQVAIFRFQEVGRGIGWRIEGRPGPGDMEILRRHIFYLTNLASEFGQDPILAALFPAPKTEMATAAIAQVNRTVADRSREQGVRKETFEKALALAQRLAPKLAIVDLALESLDKGLGHNIAALFTPQGRQAKILAVALGGDAVTINALKDTSSQFQALKALMPRLRKGEAGMDELRPLVLPLGRVGVTFGQHPLLRELFNGTPAARASS